MHDHSTRASHSRHRESARTAALLVAALFLMMLGTAFGPSLARSSEMAGETAIAAVQPEAPSALSDVANQIAITTVAAGQEGLELSAKLAEDGGDIERPIGWTITGSAAEVIFNAEAPRADVPLQPGDYMIDIRYGAAHFQRGLTLAEGNRLAVSFVLNVGGVRILPRIQNLGLPASPSRSRIFALSGVNRGQLIAESNIPGEIIRVAAGDYRIESSFEAGNAVAVADVKVKPGLMSAVEIDHAAGLARLSFVGAPDADVNWNIATETGETLAAANGLSADIVLKPGTYVASAKTGSEVLTAKFAISTGEARDIILGN